MAKTPRYKKKNYYKTIWCLIALMLLAFLQIWKKTNDVELNDILSKNEKIQAANLSVKEIITSQNKIKAYLMEDNTNPIVSINFSFLNSGYAFDSDGKKGLARLTSSLINEGITDISSTKLKEELELKAIKIGFNVDKDDFTGNLLTTKKDLFRAAEIINKMLTRPRLDKNDVIRIKNQLCEAIKRQKENPQQELQLAFAKELYGNHSYGNNPLGEIEDIKLITINDMRDFVQKKLRKDNLIVGIAGDVSEREAQKILDIMFNRLAEKEDVSEIKTPKIDFDGRNKQIERKGGQNITIVAMKGAERNDKDFYPLFVANHILGGAGLSSKLSQQVREKEGLTYGIYSYLVINNNAPLIMMSFSATKENHAKAHKSWRNVFVEFVNDGMKAKDLEKAKNYLIGSYNLRFAAIENIAEILTAMQKYNLGLDFLQKRNEYIKQVTLDEANQTAKKYFDTSKIISAEIGEF